MLRSSVWSETTELQGEFMKLGFASVVSVLLVLAACSQPMETSLAATGAPPPPTPVPLPQAILPDGFVVNLELATTPEETTTGLMFRPALAEDRGMLLLWTEERLATIWMMNVLVPLDIIYLDDAGLVVTLVADAQPCQAEPCPRFTTEVPSRAVLEIPAGGAAAHGIEVGSVITFERVPGYPSPNEE
jgi:uncharacterized membrane protein (UPF0127 family)